VILDEAHYLKNTNAKRVKALLGPGWDGHDGAIAWALHVWHLTGTPMANDPADIFTFLRMCWATSLSKEAFIQRYFKSIQTRYGSRQEPKDDTVRELQAMIANNAIRRTQASVGLELPPIFLTSTLVDGDTDAIRKMLSEHPGLEQAILTAIEQGGLSFLDAQSIATLRRLVGEAKAVPYGHMLLEELTSGDVGKRVVYGIHRQALKTLKDFLWDNRIYSVLVQGGIAEQDRMVAVSEFQENPDCRVFIANMRAAGTGLTLTAAYRIDVLESDWSPAGNAQAIKRVHRIGQAHNVHARFITLANSIDEMVNKVVARKTAMIASIEGVAMNAAPLDVPA